MSFVDAYDGAPYTFWTTGRLEAGNAVRLITRPTITGPATAYVENTITLSATATTIFPSQVITKYRWKLPNGTVKETDTHKYTFVVYGIVGEYTTIECVAVDNLGNYSLPPPPPPPPPPTQTCYFGLATFTSVPNSKRMLLIETYRSPSIPNHVGRCPEQGGYEVYLNHIIRLKNENPLMSYDDVYNIKLKPDVIAAGNRGTSQQPGLDQDCQQAANSKFGVGKVKATYKPYSGNQCVVN